MSPEYLLSEDFEKFQENVANLRNSWKNRLKVHKELLVEASSELREVVEKSHQSGIESVLDEIAGVSTSLAAINKQFDEDKARIVAALKEINDAHGL